MKRTLFVGLVGLVAVAPCVCFGGLISWGSEESGECPIFTENTEGKENCAMVSEKVYSGCKRVYSCDACKIGYTRTEKILFMGDYNISFYYCQANGNTECTIPDGGTSDDPCAALNAEVSDDPWIAYKTGYLAKTRYSWNAIQCKCIEYSQVACDTGKGYYGTPRCLPAAEGELPTCTGCTFCTDGSETWWDAETGYEALSSKYWSNYSDSCVDDPKYRCDAGYYGTATCSWLNGTRTCSGCSACPAGYYKSYGGDGARGDVCTRCPSSGGVYGTTTAGATAVTQCYIPAGDISWTDSTGTYTCGEDSYYAN